MYGRAAHPRGGGNEVCAVEGVRAFSEICGRDEEAGDRVDGDGHPQDAVPGFCLAQSLPVFFQRLCQMPLKFAVT